MMGFRRSGNPELVGQPEAHLQTLGFEQVPGPLIFRFPGWASEPVEEVEKEFKRRNEQIGKEILKVSGTTIEIHVPKFYPTLSEKDWFTITEWHIKEGDIVQLGNLLVTIECAVGFLEIPTPPQAVTQPHRVKHIFVPAGGSTHLGEAILTLELDTEQHSFAD